MEGLAAGTAEFGRPAGGGRYICPCRAVSAVAMRRSHQLRCCQSECRPAAGQRSSHCQLLRAGRQSLESDPRQMRSIKRVAAGCTVASCTTLQLVAAISMDHLGCKLSQASATPLYPQTCWSPFGTC